MSKIKKIAAILLCMALIISDLSFFAYADLFTNSPEYNQEIIQALRDLAGSEKEAEEYYSLLEKYGLLDEDGNVVDNLNASIDGVEYTGEEIIELLSGEYDGDKVAIIDGTPITLDNLYNIIVIEGYIDYLRENYYNNGGWTAEHEKNYQSFLKQLNSNNLTITMATDSTLEGDYSGINHGAAVYFTAEYDGNKATVTAHLTSAKQGQTVSFDYETVSGSAKVSGETGKVEMTADKNGDASAAFTVKYTVEDCSVLMANQPVWYVSIKNLMNAVVDVSASTAEVVSSGHDCATLKLTAAATVGSGFAIDRIVGTFEKPMGTESGKITFSSGEKYAINNGLISSVEEYYLDQALSFSRSELEDPGGNYNIIYKLSAENGTVLFNNKIPVEVSVQKVGDKISGYSYNTRLKIKSKYGVNGDYSNTHSMTGITVNEGMTYSYSGKFEAPKFRFVDKTKPSVKSIYAPDAEFSTGMSVPIIVDFSEGVSPNGAYLVVNGIKVYAGETKNSNRLSFLYPVQTKDTVYPVVSELYVKDAAGNAFTSTDLNPGSADGTLVIRNAEMHSCLPQAAIASLKSSVNYDDPTKPVLNVTVGLIDDAETTAFIASDLDDEAHVNCIKAAIGGSDPAPFKLSGSVVAGGEMVASFPLDPVTEQKSRTVELYINDELFFGFLDRVEQQPLKLVKAEDLSASVLVKNSKNGAYEYENPEKPVIYLQDEPRISAYFSLGTGDFAFGDITNVTVLDSNGKPVDASADFAWSSSDTSVANIDSSGKIAASGAGSVYFTLTALNGNFEGKAASVKTETLTFGEGLTPFLSIPNKRVKSETGKAVPVFWSSNILSKNPNGSFSITVEDSVGTQVYSQSNIKECSALIPEGTLVYDYDNARTNTTFIFTVSSTYEGVKYTDRGRIVVSYAPAEISLDPLDSYYFTDSRSNVTVNWDVSNFVAGNSSQGSNFRLYVTRNSEPVVDSHDIGTGSDGKYRGSCDIEISDVVTSASDPTSYRDIYTVSLQVKNGKDSTWSYASCVFYVYDRDALKLWVNGEEYSGKLKMTNIPEISEMNQEQILALKRDISLKSVISINYGEYAWNEISDKIAWSSSNSDVSSVNYRQSSFYAPIERYTYTSYRPMTEFMLAGLSDGEATVTAQHVFTGLSSTLDVEVETLRDKLYLFSVSPSAETTAYYTDGNGMEKTAVSDENGRFAIYEESGINSDVYFTSVSGGADYYGTYYLDSIVSGEEDPVNLNLYPCNNLVLRRAAYAYVYLKNPDGSPYTGEISVRGGVYLNGEYLRSAQFAFAQGKPATNPGDRDNSVTLGSDGKLTVVMDNTQWGLGDRELNSYDELSYKFIVRQEGSDDYLPLLIELDAQQNEEDYVRTGEAVSTFRKNEAGNKHPFVISEKLITKNNNESTTINILDNTGCVGVSDLYLEEEIIVSVMWWGSNTTSNDTHDMSLITHNKYEVNPDGKTVSDTTFPFSDAIITTLAVPFDTEIAKEASISKAPTGLKLKYSFINIKNTYTEDLSFRIADTTGNIFGETEIINMVDGIDKAISTAQPGELGECSPGDRFMTMFLQAMSNKDYSPKKDSKGFDMQIIATEDPTVFIGYISAGISNMKNTNPTGVYADGKHDELPKYYPGLREIRWGLSTGKTANKYYWSQYDEDLSKLNAGKWLTEPHYTIAGYLEQMIYLDETGSWQMRVLSGGLDAGGGLSVVKYFNTAVGPIPVTFELKGGGTAEVSLDALTMMYLNNADEIDTETEFLTQFRVFAYFKAFGGIGFDISVAALKIGLYGQINFSLTCEWLNRSYMDTDERPIRYLDGEEMKYYDEVMSGQEIEISGQVGIEFVAKLLFASYEKVLFSWDFGGGKKWDFNGWKNIDKLWKTSQQYYGSALTTLINSGSADLSSSGQLSLNLAPVKEDFSYLESGVDRTWNSVSLSASGLGAVEDSEVKLIQSNANPFTNPVISDDGSIMVYLSDADGEGDDSVHIAYALNNGSGYTDKGIICNEGAGDSGNAVAGTSDFAVAAWTSLGEAMDKDAGSVLTDEDTMIMLEGSEIYASVYSGGSWSSVKLTDDDSADIAPVVAVNGSRAMVAWRNVATSNLHGDISDFNTRDTILCKTFDGENWSEVQTVYNGSSGNVKALNAAMLGDGTAALIYTLDTDRDTSTTDDREILWATVTPEGTVDRTVQATTDAIGDENPQITVTSINGEECFAAAWYSYSTQDGDLSYDIHMADFGADGVIRGSLPQSMKQDIESKNLTVSPDFRLTKNSKDVTELSLVWVERTESEREGLTVESDILNSVKFYTCGENNEIFAVTPAQTVATAPDSTLIDSFDAYSDGDRIISVMLGTTYDPNETVEKVGTTLDGIEVTYSVAKNTSSIYSASGRYTDSIKVLEVGEDLGDMHPGTSSAVTFSVMNDGINPVTSLTVNLGGQETVVNGLNLLPGDSVVVYVEYLVPDGSLEDTGYTVSAQTKAGTFMTEGTAEFGKPELELISAEIVSEDEGNRSINFKLCNTSESKLEGSGRSVQVGFYTDSTCESPVYGLGAVTIADDETLRMIDEGGYSRQIDFNVKEYLKEINGEVTEIPTEGIPIFVKAVVFEDGEKCTEINDMNNTGSVVCENLKSRTGRDFSTGSALLNSEEGTVVTVDVKNNSLTETSTGNVIVTLFDEDGGVLGQKQSYKKGSENNGLITIDGEETENLSFGFEEDGAYAEVMFTDAVLDSGSDATLSDISVSNVQGVTISAFTGDETKPGYFTLTTEKTDITSTSIVYSTTDPDSVVTLNGETLGGYTEQELKPGSNTFDIVVTAPDGETVNHYVLTVVTPEEYTLSFVTNGGPAVESITGIREFTSVSLADIQPEWYGYHFGGWYSDTALETAVTEVTMASDTTVYAKWIENSKHNSPENIGKTDESKCSACDGTITGLTNEMEYSYEGGGYVPCTGVELTGLKPGTYRIRYAETKDFKASDPVKVEIAKGDCYGGCATCMEKAVCEGCGEEYGKKNSDNHIYYGDFESDKENHWLRCECGHIEGKAKHIDADNDMVCDVCGYDLTAVTEITNMPSMAGIPYKGTLELNAGSEYGKVIYSSSNPEVATVDENGVVTAVYKGTCIITAEIEGTDIKKECQVGVGMTFCQIIRHWVAEFINNVLVPFAEKIKCECLTRTLVRIADFLD